MLYCLIHKFAQPHENNMYIDNVIFFFYTYALYFIIPLVFFKVLTLLWYKPYRPSYVFRNFFNIYGKYSLRDEKMERWLKFKKLHNPATALLYISMLIWIISFLIYSHFASYGNTSNPNL